MAALGKVEGRDTAAERRSTGARGKVLGSEYCQIPRDGFHDRWLSGFLRAAYAVRGEFKD